MNRKKKILMLCIVLIIVSIVGCYILLKGSKEEIYYNYYGFDMGRIQIKVYENGIVEEDVEIEDPRHSENYKYLKTLSKNELDEIKNNIDNKNCIYRIIYGKEYTGKIMDHLGIKIEDFRR